jgi:hypothetical protein
MVVGLQLSAPLVSAPNPWFGAAIWPSRFCHNEWEIRMDLMAVDGVSHYYYMVFAGGARS